VEIFLKSSLANRSSTLKKIDRFIPQEKFQKIQAPASIHEEEYEWQILYPFPTNTASAAQDKPMVARLVFPTCSILLASDISQKIEEELVQKNYNLRSDILIQGRHVKEENLSETFLEAVKPKHFLFHGGGYWNLRLSPEQQYRLRKRNIRIWNLKESGAITILINKDSFALKSFNNTK
jgi:beta-lactamase superfamily II metal-dependent hydrolase